MSLLDLRLNHKTQTVVDDGERWTYLDTDGSGPALVILPCAFAGCEAFFAQVLSLGAKNRVVVVGYPGQTPEVIVGGLLRLLRRIGTAGPVVLAGWGFGAYLAQCAARRPGLLVAALVLVNGFADPSAGTGDLEPKLQALRRLLPEALKENYRQVLLTEANSGSDVLEVVYSLVAADVAKARLLQALAAPALPPLAGPTPYAVHLVNCDQDPSYQCDGHRQLRHMYPDAALHHIAAGYFSFAVTPDEVNAVLAAALSQIPNTSEQ